MLFWYSAMIVCTYFVSCLVCYFTNFPTTLLDTTQISVLYTNICLSYAFILSADIYIKHLSSEHTYLDAKLKLVRGLLHI